MRWHIVWYVVNAFFVYLLKSEISIKEMKNKRFATGNCSIQAKKATFVLLFENVNKF